MCTTPVRPGGDLSRFRQEFYQCLTRPADALFDLGDAVLCADGPVGSVAELSLLAEHRRGHGNGYAALADGQMDIQRLRTALSGIPLPRATDGQLVLAVDITCWLRPQAHTSPQRTLCHTYGRGKDTHIIVPGWPYSVIVAWETGRGSWTAPLDAVQPAPGDDAMSVTAVQVRDVMDRPITTGHWQTGDPDILLIADAGYDEPRLAHVRGFRNLRPHLACPASVPKPSRPGPGRPAGTSNHQPAPRYDVHTVTSTNTRKPTHGKKPESTNPRPRRTGQNSS